MKFDLVCFLVMMITILFSVPEITAQNLLRNPGFETFANGEPKDWTTSNISGMLVLVSQSKEAHSGKGGIRLEVKSFYGTKMAGTATQDDIPTTSRQLRFTGFYKLTSVGGDKAFINVWLINEKESTISGENLELEPTASFKEFSLSLDAHEENAVAKARVCLAIIAGEKDQLHEGTIAIFDDIVLKPLSPEKEVIGESR